MRRCFVLALLGAASAFAQDPAPAAEEDPNLALSVALRRLQTAENVVASVEVKHAPPEQQQAGGAGQLGVIIQTQVVGQEEPFEGRLEACRAADGSVVLLSEKELRGLAIYVGNGRSIERTTFEEERFSLDQLRGELSALLDPAAVAQRVFDAKLEPTRDAATGEITFRGKVDRDIVPATGGEMAFFTRGRVLDAHATLVVDPEGRLKSATVKITRSDPTREMMRGQVRRFVIQGGPGGVVPPAPADDDNKHDIPGGSTTYTISFREGPPSERARAFKEEVERILAPAKRGDPPPPGPGRTEQAR